jgi:hypothetical protein
MLIEAGAAVEARDDQQETPLHIAAQEGSSEVCRVLIEAGAAVEAQTARQIFFLEIFTQISKQFGQAERRTNCPLLLPMIKTCLLLSAFASAAASSPLPAFDAIDQLKLFFDVASPSSSRLEAGVKLGNYYDFSHLDGSHVDRTDDYDFGRFFRALPPAQNAGEQSSSIVIPDGTVIVIPDGSFQNTLDGSFQTSFDAATQQLEVADSQWNSAPTDTEDIGPVIQPSFVDPDNTWTDYGDKAAVRPPFNHLVDDDKDMTAALASIKAHVFAHTIITEDGEFQQPTSRPPYSYEGSYTPIIDDDSSLDLRSDVLGSKATPDRHAATPADTEDIRPVIELLDSAGNPWTDNTYEDTDTALRIQLMSALHHLVDDDKDTTAGLASINTPTSEDMTVFAPTHIGAMIEGEGGDGAMIEGEDGEFQQPTSPPPYSYEGSYTPIVVHAHLGSEATPDRHAATPCPINFRSPLWPRPWGLAGIELLDSTGSFETDPSGDDDATTSKPVDESPSNEDRISFLGGLDDAAQARYDESIDTLDDDGNRYPGPDVLEATPAQQAYRYVPRRGSDVSGNPFFADEPFDEDDFSTAHPIDEPPSDEGYLLDDDYVWDDLDDPRIWDDDDRAWTWTTAVYLGGRATWLDRPLDEPLDDNQDSAGGDAYLEPTDSFDLDEALDDDAIWDDAGAPYTDDDNQDNAGWDPYLEPTDSFDLDEPLDDDAIWDDAGAPYTDDESTGTFDDYDDDDDTSTSTFVNPAGYSSHFFDLDEPQAGPTDSLGDRSPATLAKLLQPLDDVTGRWYLRHNPSAAQGAWQGQGGHSPEVMATDNGVIQTPDKAIEAMVKQSSKQLQDRSTDDGVIQTPDKAIEAMAKQRLKQLDDRSQNVPADPISDQALLAEGEFPFESSIRSPDSTFQAKDWLAPEIPKALVGSFSHALGLPKELSITSTKTTSPTLSPPI